MQFESIWIQFELKSFAAPEIFIFPHSVVFFVWLLYSLATDQGYCAIEILWAHLMIWAFLTNRARLTWLLTRWAGSRLGLQLARSRPVLSWSGILRSSNWRCSEVIEATLDYWHSWPCRWYCKRGSGRLSVLMLSTWVLWIDLNGMLKKSFWDKQPGIIQPRREDTFSSKIYKVWKAARNSRAPGAMNRWKSGTYSRPVYSHLRGGPGIQKKTSYRGKNFRSSEFF